MVKLSRKDIGQLAQISSLDIHEDEIAPLMGHIEQILSYAERVSEVAQDVQEPSSRNVNIMRDDVVIESDPEPILAQAPEREGNYFVVPRILDGGE